MIPNNWKTRLGYRDQLLKFIGDDTNFCDYLVKMNGSKALDAIGSKSNNQENQNKKKDTKDKNLKTSQTKEINILSTSDFYKPNNNLNKETNESTGNLRYKHQSSTLSGEGNAHNENNMNYEIHATPIKKKSSLKNLMQINESHKQEEYEEDKNIRKKSSFLGNFTSPKRFNNTNLISEKEKRTILEHYRSIYSFKKNSNNKLSETSKKTDKKFPFFPVITNEGRTSLRNSINLPINQDTIRTQSTFVDRISPDEKEGISINQKNSMFRSSIYTNLMSTKTKSKFRETNNVEIDTDLNNSFNKTKGRMNKNKSQTTYGPFLNINNQYDQKIEIKNPEIKRGLEDINNYGPYFSHCPICRHKNMEFYQTMEPHQCMKLLNYIKMKRSKIYVK